jgi:uncharacterized membrane protein YeaQ/YmgE (transglycosylase-associated protein family)
MLHLVLVIIIGTFSGWLAGQIWKGKGFGLFKDLVIGILGSWVGGFVFGILGFGSMSVIGDIIASVVGALLLLWIMRKILSK